MMEIWLTVKKYAIILPYQIGQNQNSPTDMAKTSILKNYSNVH